MHSNTSGEELLEIIRYYFETTKKEWLFEKIKRITTSKSARELFISFSLCGTKLGDQKIQWNNRENSSMTLFFSEREAKEMEVGRIALLTAAIESDSVFFVPKVQQLLQIADNKELVTILKYLIMLPQSEKFKSAAVEALRTNVADVFDAIALANPYPSRYFNEQQWNQMYLKAAFMQRDLGHIVGIEQRANKALARIISDYAHERWAASREIDPEIWRPVASFLEGPLVNDIKRLFNSENTAENRAAALVCFHATSTTGAALLEEYPQHRLEVEQQQITWQTIKN